MSESGAQARLGRSVLKATWLSRKPFPESALVAAFSTFLLAAASLLFWTGALHADRWMSATEAQVWGEGQYWRAWTTVFAHADLGHLVANAFLFFILSFFLYGYFGAGLFPVAALFWGGLINLISLRTYEPSVELIGASGVVYWMGGAWLILYFFLSQQKNFTHRLLRSLGVAILLFMPAEAFAPQVSYRTHLIGFVAGLLAGAAHYVRHRKRFREAEIREFEFDEDLDLENGPVPNQIEAGSTRLAVIPAPPSEDSHAAEKDIAERKDH